MERYFFDDEEFDTYDDAWEAASDDFWNNGDFENFWRDEVDLCATALARTSQKLKMTARKKKKIKIFS